MAHFVYGHTQSFYVASYHMSLLPAHVDGHLRGCINISILTGCKYLPMMFYGGHLHGAWQHDTLKRKYRSKRDEHKRMEKAVQLAS